MNEQTERKKNPPRFFLPAAPLAVAVALLAAAAAGWQWFDGRAAGDQRAAIAEKIARQENALAALHESQARLDAESLSASQWRAEMDALRAEAAAQAAEARRETEALAAAVERLSLEAQSGRELLLLDEVEHLLHFAARRVALAADPDAAQAALEIAEGRLRASGDAGLYEARRLVAETLAQLRAARRTDYGALAIELGALALTVDGLPLKHDFRPPADGKTSPPPPPPAAGGEKSWWSAARWRAAWRAFSAELGADLKDLIRIRKHESAPGVLLAPEQRYFLVENIRLLLLGAQQAVLRERPQAARQNLAHCESLLRDYFYLPDAAVQATLAAIARIHAATGVAPDYPLPDAAIAELRRLRAERGGAQARR
ncbi:MAG: uroporphyrinogen-III C-methyltransferase [Gammaproteobacteria bacterium]|nr:uroporphyrinogen-III C-methyltransferase [Gammaproteobacteria bacterium]MDD9815803.1 uroporphyrinogen-III C-methyltransferase [Gammaproteobacteria bacterium]MDD9851582.1 uroporphyrinogen-III C-methyltransferase [Gammaproteobacteria bacterium]MDD9871110.1 uroporphyrinogen-III C-methyltransferase [Gammaproteobacteria bacterium]